MHIDRYTRTILTVIALALLGLLGLELRFEPGSTAAHAQDLVTCQVVGTVDVNIERVGGGSAGTSVPVRVIR